MKNAEYYIKHLNLKPHLEGGYYMESFHGEDKIKTGTAEGIEKERFLWTSIYFMLCTGEVSHFHRLESDELWYYHDGEALTIYMITPEGQLITKQLGCHMENNEQPQILVPKGYIFGSAMNQDG